VRFHVMLVSVAVKAPISRRKVVLLEGDASYEQQIV